MATKVLRQGYYRPRRNRWIPLRRDNRTTVVPAAASLATTPRVPALVLTVRPGTRVMTVTGFAPGVSAPVAVIPGPAGLVTVAFAPVVSSLVLAPSSITMVGSYSPAAASTGSYGHRAMTGSAGN